jgi:hypothetical protein
MELGHGAFGTELSCESRALMNGISVLIKEAPASSCEDTTRGAIYETESGTLTRYRI